jgi:hypothetical protein
MYFKQFYLNCLAHASYLIGSERLTTEDQIMKIKILALLVAFLMLNGITFAQKKLERSSIKTVRLHIDGFLKSKSGAV